MCCQAASDIAPIDIVVLIIPVAPGDHRLPRKSPDLQDFLVARNRKQIGGDLPAEHRVDDVL